MKISKILQVAQMHIGMGWTQGANARNGEGLVSFWDSSTAVCWCANGAVHAASDSNVEVVSATGYLHQAADVDNIAVYNDANGRTQDDILNAFSRAIELAEAAGD